MLNWFKKKPSTLIIGEMTPADLPWIADIHAASFSKAWSDGTLREMLAGKGMVGLLVRQTGRRKSPLGPDILGFLIYRAIVDEAEIITIATAKSSRRSGVGGALLEEMIRRCLADRLQSIFLEVDETNKAAIGLYKKYGFSQAGMRKAYYTQAKSNVGGSRAAKDALANTAPPAHDAIIMRLSIKD